MPRSAPSTRAPRAGPSHTRSQPVSPPLSIRALPQALLEQLAALTPAQLATLTETERLEIAESLDAHERWEAIGSLRAFAESPHFCGLTLSPLMAAIMDAASSLEPIVEARPQQMQIEVAALKRFLAERGHPMRLA